jgi:hypothetical protein
MMSCCTTMMTMSRNADEWAIWIKELEARFGPTPGGHSDPPRQLVTFSPRIGCYLIDNTAIYFCPWCGAALPRPAGPPYPTKHDEKQERVLDELEIAKLPFLDRVRTSLLQGFAGASLESERVSHSEKHGYIFRYIERSSSKMPDGRVFEHQTQIVIFGKDGEALTIATIPLGYD